MFTNTKTILSSTAFNLEVRSTSYKARILLSVSFQINLIAFFTQMHYKNVQWGFVPVRTFHLVKYWTHFD
jgi:hypothetical protein